MLHDGHIGLKLTFFFFCLHNLSPQTKKGAKVFSQVRQWFCTYVSLVRIYHWLSSKKAGKANNLVLLAFIVKAGKGKGVENCCEVNLLTMSETNSNK